MGRTFVFCGTLYLLVLTDVYRGLSAPMRSAWQPLCCGSGTWAVKTWVTGPYCCAAQEQACRLQVGDPRPRPLSAPPMLLLGCGFLFSLLPVSHHLAQAYLFQAASVWVRFVWAACGVRQVGTQETVWPNHASLSWQEPWEPETLVPPSQPPVCWWQCWSRIRACRSSGEPSAPVTPPCSLSTLRLGHCNICTFPPNLQAPFRRWGGVVLHLFGMGYHAQATFPCAFSSFPAPQPEGYKSIFEAQS